MDKEIELFLKFNQKLHNFIDEKFKSDIKDGDNKAFFLVFSIGKAYKTHEAIMLLSRNGYGEDSFMLARTLLELMITTSYILQDSTEDTLIRYASYDWVTRKKMYDYIATKDNLMEILNREIEARNTNNTIAQVEEEYKKVMEKYKYKNGTWSDKNIKGMADTIGRSDIYHTVYSLQCTVSHNNARSMNEYIRVTDEGTFFNIGPNWELVKSTLVIVFDCFYHIIKEADNHFKWEAGEMLDEISKNWSDEVDKIKHDKE